MQTASAYDEVMFNVSPLQTILPPLVTALYAAALAVLFVVLSWRALRIRRKLRIGIGDAGNPSMLRAMRVHANFAEYVPFCLGMMCLAELQAAPAWLVHGLGASLVLARVIHSFGVSQMKENVMFRVFGIALTLCNLLVSSIYLIFVHIR